jgi:hypothetical protein
MKKTIALLILVASVCRADPPFGDSSAAATANNANTFNPTNVSANANQVKNQVKNAFKPTNINRVKATNTLKNRIKTSQNQSQSSSNTNTNIATGGAGGNSKSIARGGSARVNANPIASAPTTVAIEDNSTNIVDVPDATVVTDFVDWKRYQWERAQHRSKGEIIGSLDPRVSTPVKGYVAPQTAKARYDRFLRSKGVNPKTMGAATILDDGTMYVPSIEEEYASGKPGNSSLIAQNLAAAAE